jgi:hypothetical protein
LARKADVTTDEIEELVRLLILDRKLGRNGKVDPAAGLLVFDELYGEMEEIDPSLGYGQGVWMNCG